MSQRIELASRWMYQGVWRIVVEWFRVPAEPPALPVQPGDFSSSFQPASGFLRYMKFWFWVIGGAIDLGLTIGYIAAAIALWRADLWWVAILLLPVAAFIIVVPDVIAYVAIHLRYDTTWYVMTDRSVRIRRGIWIIHETTITFENVQNLKVQQGPLQRHFGIANLVVETAGAGGDPHQKGAGGISNKGIIEGLANALDIRDRILARMKQSKGAGLGDDAPTWASPWSPPHVDVLREIRAETRALSASSAP